MKQKIIFTALPFSKRTEEAMVILSVLISPQVPDTGEVVVNEINTTLDQLPDMQQLPLLLSKATIMVQVSGGTPFATGLSLGDANNLNLWQDLFSPKKKPAVKVRSYIPPEDAVTVPILSYPVTLIDNHIKKVVQAVGTLPTTEMPSVDSHITNPDLLNIANYVLGAEQVVVKGPLRSIITPARGAADVKRQLLTQPFIPYDPNMPPNLSFAQLCNFHGVYDAKTRQKPTPIPVPNFEFHDIISVLTQHPTLMRQLGLLVDIPIPISKLPSGTGSIRIIPSGLSFTSPTEVVCPATAYLLTEKGFYTAAQVAGSTAPSDSFYERGYVKINDKAAFSVVQVDTDGGALKYVSHIDALLLKTHRQRQFIQDSMFIPSTSMLQAYGNENSSRGEGLPSHRSGGIAIVKNGLAGHLNKRFKRMNDLKKTVAAVVAFPQGISNTNATYIPGQDTLTADDVVTGYRIDVSMTDGVGTSNGWQSLHFYNGDYKVATTNGAGTSIGNIMQEGFIQLTTTEDANISGRHMKLSEVIGRWEGWSLAVPMPGKSLNEPTLEPVKGKEITASDEEESKKFTTPDQVPFRLNIIPQIAKGTLPRLRFGQTYALKMRTVDMAGNSTPFNDDPELPADSVVTGIRYRRYEPVDVPMLIPGEAFRDGESSEVMVIRSSEEVSVAAFENNPANQFSGQPKVFEAVCTRHVKPPRTTVGMAITHGMVEKAIGESASGIAAVYNDIKSKDPEVIALQEDTQAKPVSSSTPLLNVEYLADPMAAGVVVYISPADEHQTLLSQQKIFNKWIPFYFDNEISNTSQANIPLTYEAWMAPRTFRVVLKESNAFNVEWSKTIGERKLLVSVPKGHTLKLNYASFWRPADLEKLSGVLSMLGITSLSKPQQAFAIAIAEGRHWMFSPWRTISFVHAVQRPLTTIGSLGAVPPPTPLETTGFSVTAILSSKPLAPDVAQYDKQNPLPRINSISADRNFNQDFTSLNLNADIHAASTGLLDIEATWTDVVDDGIQPLPDGLDAAIPVSRSAKVHHLTTDPKCYNYNFGELPSAQQLVSPIQKLADGNIQATEPAILHYLNDTRHRIINYKVTASTRYKEYFFRLINKPGSTFDITRPGITPKSVNVLSSAPPLAPQIAYVLPIFEWGEAPDPKDPKTLVRGRSAGLRVYLRRPWFSSGEGEKLAVVIKNPTVQSGKPQLDETIYTTWGNDPAMVSPGAGGIFPTAGAFLASKIVKPNGTYTEQKLTVSDVPGAVADIAAYEVRYDSVNKLYYADLMLFFGSAYFPFIRLALAAYQQHSVRKQGLDCCLSKVVRADYIQIPPPRFTSLRQDTPFIEVAISGTAAMPLPNFITHFEFRIEAPTPLTEDIIVSTNDDVLQKFETDLTANAIDPKTFTFRVTNRFPTPPKPYRVRILEYEVLPTGVRSEFSTGFVSTNKIIKQGAAAQRLVFADAYDVK